jgi:uncharacterized phage protein gp47/JayE
LADYLKKDFAGIVDGLLADLSSGHGGRVALTDTTEGSVVRTLVEAFSRELAVAYAQLDQVYQLGYLDTARGEALDNVVALVGVKRRRGGYLQGTVTFSRATPATADIAIPAGTPVAGKGLPPFETTAPTILPTGGMEATVPVRALELPLEAPGLELLKPGALTVMVRPLHGVEAVTNRVALVPPQRDETDDELRERARNEVSGANLGTPAALRFALRGLGLSQVDVQEVPDRPGVVDVVVGDPGFEALRAEALRLIEEVRPAGVRVRLSGVSRVWVAVTATLELDKPYAGPERQAVEESLRQSLRAYVESLGVNENVREGKVSNVLAGHPKVLAVYPGAGGRLLRAYVETGVTVKDVTGERRTPQGDVLVHAGERAGIDRLAGVEPYALVLEPPSPQVLIDVELQLTSAVAGAEELLRASSSMREYLASLVRPEGASYNFNALVAALPLELRNALASARFTAVHERDGRVVQLDDAMDSDTLLGRERPKLRNVAVLGGAP